MSSGPCYLFTNYIPLIQKALCLWHLMLNDFGSPWFFFFFGYFNLNIDLEIDIFLVPFHSLNRNRSMLHGRQLILGKL